MQAYATEELASAGALSLLDRRLAIPDSANGVAPPGNGVLDELLGQLADLVAAKVAARLAAPAQRCRG